MAEPKQRVAIPGASGYSALELIKLLLRHPQVEITALTTRHAEPRPVGQVHPSLVGRLDLALENLPLEEVAERADYVFCCLPHGASAASAAKLLAMGKKVIDLSADYRLSDPAEYAKWYGLAHADPRTSKTPSTACPSSIETISAPRRSLPTRAATRPRRSWPSRHSWRRASSRQRASSSTRRAG